MGMDITTEQANIIRRGTVVAFVLARGGEASLIETTGLPDAVSYCTALLKAGFTYHGLVGIVDGEVLTAPNDALDLECMFNMGRAHKAFSMLVPAPRDPLEDLWALPDNRDVEAGDG
jgi:hypothetical protein